MRLTGMELSARGGATAPSRSAGTSTSSASTPSRLIRKGRTYGLLAALGGLSLLMGGCTGGTGQQAMPNVRVQVGGPEGGDSMSMGVQLLLLLTVLSLVPAVLMMVTSFVRIAIVLSFARTAIGMQQMPPNQVLLGLALFMTVFVMAPVWSVVNESALQPYLRNEISMDEAMKLGQEPLREFMFKQTRERDLGLFVAMSRMPQPNTKDDVPTYALIPAFMISELKTAFQMGFIILLPFIVIDMVVSSALMSMGMMMLPPTTISLPFKVLLFVMADGWHLISRSLMTSFG